MAEFFTDYVWPLIVIVAQSVLLLVVLLIAVAYILLADRKIWAAVQIGAAPTWSARSACCSPSPTCCKFVFKEPVIPAGANKGVFLLAPLVTCVLALAAWAVIPVSAGWVIANINVGILYLFAISSLGVYGIIMGGWASNSKYPFLGALRSAAQMVSYEVSIGFVIITVLLCVGSLNLSAIVERPGDARARDPARHPLVHGAELVSGCRCSRCSSCSSSRRWPRPTGRRSTCRSGIRARRRLHGRVRLDALHAVHARRVRGDHHHVRADHDPVPRRLAAAARGAAVHLGARRSSGSCSRCCFVFFMFAMVKAFVPRYRYDQLMRLGWKVFLPLSLAMVVIVAAVLQIMRAGRHNEEHADEARSGREVGCS